MKIFKSLVLIGCFTFIILLTFADIQISGLKWWHIPMSIIFGLVFWLVAEFIFSDFEKTGKDNNITEPSTEGEPVVNEKRNEKSHDFKDWLHLKFNAKIKFGRNEKEENE